MPNYVKAKLQVSGENPKELIDSLCEVCKDGQKRFDLTRLFLCLTSFVSVVAVLRKTV